MQTTVKSWEQHATEDFQKRGDNYPSSGRPVSISGDSGGANLSFKNTSEATAKAWTKNYAQQNGLPLGKMRSCQDGDYRDDWVQVIVVL